MKLKENIIKNDLNLHDCLLELEEKEGILLKK